MTKPHSLLELQASLAQALSSLGRDELAEILTAVLEAYVVERAPRFDGPAGGRSLADLATLPFAQLVTELQMSCAQPELAALRVEGVNVQVRVGGQWVPLAAPTPNLAAPAVPVPVVPVAIAAPRAAAAAPTATPTPGPIAASPAPSASEKADTKDSPSSEAGAGDRFSLLELD
ncbi:MAG: hypothetical protein IPL79_07845 [Myxococcales bacterium]|nr:hypothetical protein [Myxococcales bacterium]